MQSTLHSLATIAGSSSYLFQGMGIILKKKIKKKRRRRRSKEEEEEEIIIIIKEEEKIFKNHILLYQ